MTDYYCWHSGDNTDGSTWAKAKTTIAAAVTAANGANGNVVFVSHTHSVNSGGVITVAPSKHMAVLCVTQTDLTTGKSGLTTGAKEQTGSANAYNILATAAADVEWHGLTIQAGADALTGSSSCNISIQTTSSVEAGLHRFNNCALNISASSSGASLIVGGWASSSATGARIEIINSSIKIRSDTGATPGIQLAYCDLFLYNTTINYAGANKPIVLFGPSTALEGPSFLYVTGDLSGYNTSGGQYFSVAGSVKYVAELCKLHATPSITTSAWSNAFSNITLMNVDSGDTHNVFEYRNRAVTITEDTGVYATDASAVNFDAAGISWAAVTTSSCTEFFKAVCPPLRAWCNTVGSVTVSVEITHSAAAPLTDRQIWLEVLYPGSSSFPSGSIANDRNAAPFFGTAADQTASSITWNTAGTYKQTLSVTVTTGEKGLITGRVVIGFYESTKTIYIDPNLRIA